MWEKYESELDTTDGPLRYVDESGKEYPHLKEFVPFDMEHWWAERSISSMINEKPRELSQEHDASSSSSSSSSTSRTSSMLSHSESSTTLTSPTATSLSLSPAGPLSPKSTNGAASSSYLSTTASSASSSSSSSPEINNDLMLMSAFTNANKALKFNVSKTALYSSKFPNLNNFQLCFS